MSDYIYFIIKPKEKTLVLSYFMIVYNEDGSIRYQNEHRSGLRIEEGAILRSLRNGKSWKHSGPKSRTRKIRQFDILHPSLIVEHNLQLNWNDLKSNVDVTNNIEDIANRFADSVIHEAMLELF